MLNELGLSITLEDMFDTFVGNSMTTCLEMIAEMLGKPVPDRFLDEYKARTKLALESHLKPINGIEEALKRIEIPYCVASVATTKKCTPLWVSQGCCITLKESFLA